MCLSVSCVITDQTVQMVRTKTVVIAKLLYTLSHFNCAPLIQGASFTSLGEERHDIPIIVYSYFKFEKVFLSLCVPMIANVI